MLIGFRGDVQRDDPCIQAHVLREHLPRFLPPFERDVRLNYGVGWPESMCRETDHLKRPGRREVPRHLRWHQVNLSEHGLRGAFQHSSQGFRGDGRL